MEKTLVAPASLISLSAVRWFLAAVKYVFFVVKYAPLRKCYIFVKNKEPTAKQQAFQPLCCQMVWLLRAQDLRLFPCMALYFMFKSINNCHTSTSSKERIVCGIYYYINLQGGYISLKHADMIWQIYGIIFLIKTLFHNCLFHKHGGQLADVALVLYQEIPSPPD